MECRRSDANNLPYTNYSAYHRFVTYVVIHGRSKSERQATASSLGDAARLAVRYLKEGRRDVRVRLPEGDTLDFEAFQEAVFAGRLRETRPAQQPQIAPAPANPFAGRGSPFPGERSNARSNPWPSMSSAD
jgi:hypothetical protein